MKEYLISLPKRMRVNLSINVLTIGLLLFYLIASVIAGDFKMIITGLGIILCYLAGGGLDKINKYLPIVLAGVSIGVFAIAAFIFAITHVMPRGFCSYAMVVLLFSMIAFVNTHGKKCAVYGLVMAGSGCVLSLALNDNGMIIWMGVLAIAIMLTDDTYTAMSKYVFSLFIWTLTVKFVGLLFFVNKMELTGIVKQLSENAYVFIALVVLGFVSLLLKERHPRIKSDRDKKHIPALRLWKTVVGITIIFIYIWSVIGFSDLFAINSGRPSTQFTSAFVEAMLYGVVYYDTASSTLFSILTNYGFLVMLITVVMMICFVYRAYEDYKESKTPSAQMLFLIILGFVISIVCSKAAVPVLMLFGLFAGCLVNRTEQK